MTSWPPTRFIINTFALCTMAGSGVVPGCSSSPPGSGPAKPAVEKRGNATPARPAARPSQKQGTAWFVLSWNMSPQMTIAALEKAGVQVVSKRFAKTGRDYLTFKRNHKNGTVYFNRQNRMTSILLQQSGLQDPAAAKRARKKMTRRFGAALPVHTVLRRRWRNPYTTLTVTHVPTALTPQLLVECGSDRDPQRPTPEGLFAKVRGYATLAWGMKPKKAQAAAQKLGFKAQVVTRRRRPDNVPNANAMNQPRATYPVVELRGAKGTGELSFDDKDRLTQIIVRTAFPTRAALDKHMADLETQYGPPHTQQRTDTVKWKKGKTLARLIITLRKPGPVLDLSERYLPER